MRRVAGVIVLVALLAIVAMAGCAKKSIVAVQNLPPETTLFVQGSLDTVNHIVRLFWFGSDPDGEIVGYEFMIDNPAQPESAHWVFTNRTDSLFTIHAPAGYAIPTFRVRAIDNSPTPRPADAPVNAPSGQRDPTPAAQDFQFSNQPPTVRFTQRLIPTDTTYASVTLAWTGADADGNAQALRFQVGLDTVPAALHLVSGSGVTLDTTDFKVAGVYPTTRPRQAFIRAIDDGGRASAWDSVRWVVRAPSTPGVHPQLLLIDDVPGVSVALDNPYWTAARNLPAGSFSILRLEYTRPFRSAKDLLQTFRQFDAVVWYRGTQGQGQPPTFSTIMRDYQDGMAAYLDGGGKLMIESLNLIEGRRTVGALRPDWVTRYMGSTDLIHAPLAGEADSSASWSIAPGYVDTLPEPDVTYRSDLRSTVLDDSLRNNINTNGLRGFAVIDTLNHVALWARDSTLAPLVDRDVPIAVTVPVAGTVSGRLIVFTTPIGGANGFGNVNRFMCKLFQHMGLGVCP